MFRYGQWVAFCGNNGDPKRRVRPVIVEARSLAEAVAQISEQANLVVGECIEDRVFGPRLGVAELKKDMECG